MTTPKLHWIQLLVVLPSLLVAVGRFLIPGHDLSLAGTYEALAHVWVGVLLALGAPPFTPTKVRIWASSCLVAVTVLELVMFLLR